MSSWKWRTILLRLSGQPKLPRFSALPSSRRYQRPLSGLQTLCRNFNSVLYTLPGVAVQQTASALSEATLAFWEVAIGWRRFLQESCQGWLWEESQGIAARLPVSLSRTEVDNGGFREVLKNDFLLLLGPKKARWAYVMALVLPPWRLRLVRNLIQVLFLLKFFGKSLLEIYEQ